MSAPNRTNSQESADALRKRVCKACDRCRLKKSKCDGSSPCSRCRADNSICVFGERKKSHDKVYPKGYVEMLEQQQAQLIAGLQDTYSRLQTANLWPGQRLQETDGRPLTHDILSALGIIPQHKADGYDDHFEEACDRLQERLIARGAAMMTTRRGSVSSESDHDQTTTNHKRARSLIDTPASSPFQQTSTVRRSFDVDRSRKPSSPLIKSPANSASNVHASIRPSPLHTQASSESENFPMIDEENLMSTWEWQNAGQQMDLSQPDPQFTMSPMTMNGMNMNFDTWQGFDPNFQQFNNQQFPNDQMNMDQQINAFTAQTPQVPNAKGFPNPSAGLEWQNVDVDFSKFVKQAS